MGKKILEFILEIIITATIITILTLLVLGVLKKNDNLCKSRFGENYVYNPTMTSGYCFNEKEGQRKYLD